MKKRVKIVNQNNHLFPCFKCKTKLRWKKQSYCYECHLERSYAWTRNHKKQQREARNTITVASLPMENWVSIKEFNNYMISDFGRIKRLKYIDGYGNVHCEESVVPGYLDKKGYFGVKLYNGAAIKKMFKIHQLVAIHFILNPENKTDVHHKDSNTKNNHYCNLQWVTKSEHAAITRSETNFGNGQKGEKHGMARLKKEQVIKLRCLWETGDYTKGELAKMFNIVPFHSTRIINRKAWSHI